MCCKFVRISCLDIFVKLSNRFGGGEGGGWGVEGSYVTEYIIIHVDMSNTFFDYLYNIYHSNRLKRGDVFRMGERGDSGGKRRDEEGAMHRGAMEIEIHIYIIL
jgi:hypothetical protein